MLFDESHALWRIEPRHEAFLLLHFLYEKYTSLREILCEKIVAGPPEGLLKGAKQRNIDGYIYEILTSLVEKDLPLSPIAQKRLDEISCTYPSWTPLRHQGMSHWMESGSVNRGIDSNNIKLLASKDIVDQIVSFKPAWNSSLRDFCEPIGIRISQEPDWGFRTLESLKNSINKIPVDALNPMLWGIRATLKDKSTKIDNNLSVKLIGVLDLLVEQLPSPEAWSSLPSVLKDLIETFGLDVQIWNSIGKRLQNLFTNFDFDRTDSERPVRWLDNAINHPYGDLTALYLKVAQEHINKLSQTGQPLTLESRAQDFFDHMSTTYSRGSRYGYTLIAERMAWMETVAPLFSERMRKWFDWDENSEKFLVAWSGYLWSRTLSRLLVSDFTSTYEIAAQHHAAFGESERDGLGSHLAAVFWFHTELSPRLQVVALTIDSKIRLDMLHGWDNHLKSATPEVAVAFFEKLIFPYWDWCATQPFFSNITGQKERFFFWKLLAHSYTAFPMAVKKALERLPQASNSLHLFIDELTNDSMLEYPEDLVDLLNAWATISEHPQWNEKEWRKVWDKLKIANPKNLDQLENNLARRGLTLT